MKKMNNKGFTLAELLIVVAIIAVLVAIAIPVFNAQLEKAREATDLANIRSAYAVVVTKYLDKNGSYTQSVSVQQTQANWQNNNGAPSYTIKGFNESGTKDISVSAKTNGSYSVHIAGNGTVTVN